MHSRRGGRAIAALLAGCLLSTTACTATGPDPTPEPATTPTPSDVGVDEAATLVVSPVDIDGTRAVVATFGSADAGRPVVLQKQASSGWSDVASGKENKAGRVTFQARGGVDSDVYRAVAGELTGEQAAAAVATPRGSAAQQWKTALSTDFSGSSLDAGLWAPRGTASYHAGGRQCSAPYPTNVLVRDGEVRLSVTRETSKANIAAAKASGCEQPRVLRNAMIATEKKFSISQGVVAARVRFAEGQGMHGSVWLQSYEQSEIDMIESYGYGRGLTSVIHVDGTRYPTANEDTYVNARAVTKKDWWSAFHIYSVEWDGDQVVFRIDGRETRRITRDIPVVDYFVVISMLSSDWEQKRFSDPVRNADGVTPTRLPQTMAVDWVKAWTPS